MQKTFGIEIFCPNFYPNFEDSLLAIPDLNDENFLYLQLLSALLEKFSSLIVYFEEENRDYTKIMPKLREAFTLWRLLIIDESHIDNSSNLAKFNSLLNLPFADKKKLEKHLKNDKKFEANFTQRYPEIEACFPKVSDSLKTQVLQVAKSFIFEGFIEMYKRIPFNNKILNDCEVIQLTEFDREKFISLANQFKNIIPPHSLSQFQNELDILDYNFEDIKNRKSNS